MAEKKIETETKVAASSRGSRLFKNEIGMAKYPPKYKGGKPSFVPYGVGGVGAPDLVGWTPIVITPDMVGKTVCLFVAIEMKDGGEKPKPHQDQWREAALKDFPTLRIGWADSVERALEIMEG